MYEFHSWGHDSEHEIFVHRSFSTVRCVFSVSLSVYPLCHHFSSLHLADFDPVFGPWLFISIDFLCSMHFSLIGFRYFDNSVVLNW